MNSRIELIVGSILFFVRKWSVTMILKNLTLAALVVGSIIVPQNMVRAVSGGVGPIGVGDPEEELVCGNVATLDCPPAGAISICLDKERWASAPDQPPRYSKGGIIECSGGGNDSSCKGSGYIPELNSNCHD